MEATFFCWQWKPFAAAISAWHSKSASCRLDLSSSWCCSPTLCTMTLCGCCRATPRTRLRTSGEPEMAASPTHRVSTGERLNTAETTGKLQQAVAVRGIRMTRQRRVILQVIDDAEQHLDVDQILARAQKIDSDIHLVTVYRTIDLLKKQGLIDELDLLHLRCDRHYYEAPGPRDHIHVACLRCGKVREFESRLYEQLKEQIARDFDMQVTVSRTEVGGICNDCLSREKKSPRQ